jgi:hypothetical protein
MLSHACVFLARLCGLSRLRGETTNTTLREGEKDLENQRKELQWTSENSGESNGKNDEDIRVM